MGSICASFTCKLPAISTEDVIIAAFKYMSIFIKYAGSIFPTGFSTNFAKKALGLDPQHKISAWESEGGRKLKTRSIFIEHEKVPITLANGHLRILFSPGILAMKFYSTSLKRGSILAPGNGIAACKSSLNEEAFEP